MTDIDKAIKVLRDNYERAMKLEYVRNKPDRSETMKEK